MQNRSIKYAVSYARKDKELVEDLLDRLGVNLDLSKRYIYNRWIDSMLPPTNQTPFTDEIIAKFKESDFILLLGSPLYFTREFIKEYELPLMKGYDKKLAILVSLKPLDFANYDLMGFERYNWFSLDGKAYSKCKDEDEKDQFANALFVAIEEVLR